MHAHYYFQWKRATITTMQLTLCSPIAVFKEFTQIDYVWMSTALDQNLNFLQHFHSASFLCF